MDFVPLLDNCSQCKKSEKNRALWYMELGEGKKGFIFSSPLGIHKVYQITSSLGFTAPGITTRAITVMGQDYSMIFQVIVHINSDCYGLI